MQKLDLWRWAQYTIVGIFFILSLFFALFFPAVSLTKHTSQTSPSLMVLIITLIAYLCGLIIWQVSLHFSYYLLYFIFRVFKRKALGTHSYHVYRLELFKFFISNIKSKRKIAGFPVDEELGSDIIDYEHLVLELYHCTESLEGYLKTKLPSSWQSCSMMLALLGAVALGAIVTMVSGPFVSVICGWRYIPLQAAKMIVFIVLYFAIGLSLLQRN